MSSPKAPKFVVNRRLAAGPSFWIDVITESSNGWRSVLETPEYPIDELKGPNSPAKAVIFLLNAILAGTVKRLTTEELDHYVALEDPFTHSLHMLTHVNTQGTRAGYRYCDHDCFPVMFSGTWHETVEQAEAEIEAFTNALRTGEVQIANLEGA
jgi:hypothetical protein